jgi:hypothetical protein
MSDFFGLSICKAIANSCTVGKENVLLGLFGGGDSSKNVGLRVIAEKTKICSYLHVGKNRYMHDVS